MTAKGRVGYCERCYNVLLGGLSGNARIDAVVRLFPVKDEQSRWTAAVDHMWIVCALRAAHVYTTIMTPGSDVQYRVIAGRISICVVDPPTSLERSLLRALGTWLDQRR